MNQLGMGVMMRELMGNEESATTFRESLNKTTSDVQLNDDVLVFHFSDKSAIELKDEGQTCCESRYMRTDDDLSYYAGAVLLDGEINDAPNEPDEYGEHEVQFLEIKTDRGVFTISCHNEHNGWYGGFSIAARKLE